MPAGGLPGKRHLVVRGDRVGISATVIAKLAVFESLWGTVGSGAAAALCHWRVRERADDARVTGLASLVPHKIGAIQPGCDHKCPDQWIQLQSVRRLFLLEVTHH